MRAADNQAELELNCEQVVARAETEKDELDSPVGSYARMTTTMSTTDEPVATVSRIDGSGSADTRRREESTPPRLNNEVFQRKENDDDDDAQLQRSPPLRTEFSQQQGQGQGQGEGQDQGQGQVPGQDQGQGQGPDQGQSLDKDGLQNHHEKIREAKDDDHPADDDRKLKESSSK